MASSNAEALSGSPGTATPTTPTTPATSTTPAKEAEPTSWASTGNASRKPQSSKTGQNGMKSGVSCSFLTGKNQPGESKKLSFTDKSAYKVNSGSFRAHQHSAPKGLNSEGVPISGKQTGKNRSSHVVHISVIITVFSLGCGLLPQEVGWWQGKNQESQPNTVFRPACSQPLQEVGGWQGENRKKIWIRRDQNYKRKNLKNRFKTEFFTDILRISVIATVFSSACSWPLQGVGGWQGENQKQLQICRRQSYKILPKLFTIQYVFWSFARFLYLTTTYLLRG